MGPTAKPIYTEAYPRFDIVKAQAALERQPSICVFNLGRLPIGQLVLGDVTLNSVVIAYFIQGPFIPWSQGELRLPTKAAHNPVHPNRRSILCPSCSEPRRAIFFKQQWACAACHKLLRRSQVVDKKCRQWEEYDAISKEVNFGRPKGMHNLTYNRKLERLEEIRSYLGAKRRYTADEHDFIVTSIWKPCKDIVELWVPGYALVRGNIQPTNA